MLLIIIWYFFIIIFGLVLGLGLVALASASRFRGLPFWPSLTSLIMPQRDGQTYGRTVKTLTAVSRADAR